MDLEQYIGCIIKYNGRIAKVTGTRSNYDGDYFFLQYVGADDSFSVGAFEDELLDALPDPEYGILKRREDELVFQFDENEYVLTYHPYEPCLYMKKDGSTVRTLHNAFSTDELPERFARGETLMGIDGRDYDLKSFCNVLIAALAAKRTEMDFTFAATLARTETEYCTAGAEQKPAVMNFCPQCGNRNNGGKFCTRCGTKLVYE